MRNTAPAQGGGGPETYECFGERRIAHTANSDCALMAQRYFPAPAAFQA